MARIKRGTNENRNNIGIHLFDPSQYQIDDAKDVAYRDGYPFIYVHRTRKVVIKKKR